MAIESESCCALSVSEIKAGLVLHLDPGELEPNGARCSCAGERKVKGPHFFLCLDTDDLEGDWLPLYSKDGPGRLPLPTAGRRGHFKWTGGEFYYHREQSWIVPHTAILVAASGDHSTAENRNMLDVEQIPVF